MDVVYTAAARRGLKRMPVQDRLAMLAKLDAFARDGSGDVRKLTGAAGFRLRHGNWRAVFEIRDDMIVVKVAHRRDVYR